MKNKIIMYDSDESAKRETITGWVSAKRHFFGADEQSARYDGCTHRKCECGNITEKYWLKCEVCRNKKDDEKFAAMPRRKWDESTPLFLRNSTDQCFWYIDELEEYCEDNEMDINGIDLIIGEPVYAREINPDEYYCDDLPFDGECPQEILDAFDKLNEVIAEHLTPLSWRPGKFVAII